MRSEKYTTQTDHYRSSEKKHHRGRGFGPEKDGSWTLQGHTMKPSLSNQHLVVAQIHSLGFLASLTSSLATLLDALAFRDSRTSTRSSLLHYRTCRTTSTVAWKPKGVQRTMVRHVVYISPSVFLGSADVSGLLFKSPVLWTGRLYNGTAYVCYDKTQYVGSLLDTTVILPFPLGTDLHTKQAWTCLMVGIA
ncbi:hypothetical protein ABKN59_006777 [Abortiporus biennis]